MNWIERIFSRLQGSYGYGFTSKFATGMVNGVDLGIENAKQVWAEELGGFMDMPEAIAYAIKHLPTEKAPNVFEFRDICRRAPRKSEAVAAIEYHPTAQDKARHSEIAHKATQAVKSQIDDLHWAKFPKSRKAMEYIYDGKKHARRFPQLANIFDAHVLNGVCTADGNMLKKWNGYEWIKP
jgi:hypothetical protein